MTRKHSTPTLSTLYGLDRDEPAPLLGQQADALKAARELVREHGPEAARALLAYVAAYRATHPATAADSH